MNNYQKDLKGIEAFPHIEFWREAPEYVREGISFVISKLKGITNSSGGND